MNQKLGIFIRQILTLQLVTQDAIRFDPSSLSLKVGNSYDLKVSLINKNFTDTIYLNFTYGDENEVHNISNGIIEQLPQISFQPNETTKTVRLESKSVGHLVIGAVSNEINIPLSNVLRIDVVHSTGLTYLISVIGWIYFFAWSISFYPQFLLNYKRKSVEGLNFDFIALNLLGFSCYTIFNVQLFWIKSVQREYFKSHPRGVNPVLLNDVLFAIHATVITFLTVVQCLIYERGNQKISKLAMLIMAVLFSFLIISGIVLAAGALNILQYAYFFSYVKLAITLMKYFPQAYMNFKRKSTIGWSVLNVLLDFTGGSLSLLQMFLLAYNFNDWSSIFGSPTKFGLGFFSILFDIVFIIQHYILYRNQSPYVQILVEDESSPSDGNVQT